MSSSPAVPRPLDGQVALITGGVRRIGRATALKLASLGLVIAGVVGLQLAARQTG